MLPALMCPRGSRPLLSGACPFNPRRESVVADAERPRVLLPKSGSPFVRDDELKVDEAEGDNGEGVYDDVEWTNMDFVPSTKRPPRGGSSARGGFAKVI